jgi:hypothetical protein
MKKKIWKIENTGENLVFKYNNEVKATLTTDGVLHVADVIAENVKP